MANELKVRTQVTYTEDSVDLPIPVIEKLSSAAEHYASARMTLSSAADTLLPVGSVALTGSPVMVAWNVSATAGELISIKDGNGGTTIARLQPGECFAWRPFFSNAPYARAIAGAPKFRYWFFEDA